MRWISLSHTGTYRCLKESVPFTRASAQQNSIRNSSPAPELVFSSNCPKGFLLWRSAFSRTLVSLHVSGAGIYFANICIISCWLPIPLLLFQTTGTKSMSKAAALQRCARKKSCSATPNLPTSIIPTNIA